MLDEELGTNLFKPILFLVTCLQVVADEEKRRQARWNLKRVRTQNGGDFHVHVALREAMHDRRIADIERALIAGEECSGRSSKLHYPSLDHRWACRIQLDLGRNAACTRWSWNMQDTH